MIFGDVKNSWPSTNREVFDLVMDGKLSVRRADACSVKYRGAAIISIVETCRRLSLPLHDYLGSALPDDASQIAALLTYCANSSEHSTSRF